MRVCVHSFVILGIFAMHNVLVGGGDQMIAHHATPLAAAESSMVTAPSALGTADEMQAVERGDGHGMSGESSDCCGILMLCVAMIMGVGALLLIRRKVAERVLWQLPPPSRLIDLVRVPPFQGLTPFQRSSILRC